MITIDILQLVDRLEELFEHGKKVPMSNKVMVEEEVFLNIIDQMRISIPQEIKQAREVQLEKDRYVAQAHEEARKIIAQAREDAAKELDEHKLRQAAEAQAEAIIHRAQQEAARIRTGADDYAEAKLKELGQYVAQLGQSVAQLQATIQNGLNALESRRAQQKAEPK